jgi:hypothetical protein
LYFFKILILYLGYAGIAKNIISRYCPFKGEGGCLPEYLAGEEGDWLLLKMVEEADRTSGLQAKPFSNVQSTQDFSLGTS